MNGDIYHVEIWLRIAFVLTLKASNTTAADEKFCNIYSSLQHKQGMVFHENGVPADDSREISCLICYF